MSGAQPDVIVAWPAFCDFPLWREQIVRCRDDYGRVLVVFTRNINARTDYSDWLRENFDGAEFFEAEVRGHDWRDSAVNTALARSTSDWVLFTEPDFIYSRPQYRLIDSKIEAVRAAGIPCETGRWHPCFLFANRRDINDTSLDFSAGEKGDHFSQFSHDLNGIVAVTDVSGEWYWHLRGLTEAHHKIDQGAEVEYKPEQFVEYLYKCLDAGMALPPKWEVQARGWLATQPSAR